MNKSLFLLYLQRFSCAFLNAEFWKVVLQFWYLHVSIADLIDSSFMSRESKMQFSLFKKVLLSLLEKELSLLLVEMLKMDGKSCLSAGWHNWTSKTIFKVVISAVKKRVVSA